MISVDLAVERRVMESIKYMKHPVIEEILAQQRIILEINKELMKLMLYPPIIYTEKKWKHVRPLEFRSAEEVRI